MMRLIEASIVPTREPLLSRNKAFAALGAAGGQHLAAVRGFHAGTEAVRAGALEPAGLESAFHGMLRSRCAM